MEADWLSGLYCGKMGKLTLFLSVFEVTHYTNHMFPQYFGNAMTQGEQSQGNPMRRQDQGYRQEAPGCFVHLPHSRSFHIPLRSLHRLFFLSAVFLFFLFSV